MQQYLKFEHLIIYSIIKYNDMKKKTALVVLSFIFSGHTFAQNPNWLWAKAAAGSGNQEGLNVATDVSGNVFVSGFFNYPSMIFGTIVLTSAGMNDIFLAKYDGAGNVLWAIRAGGSGDDWAQGLTTDASGNVFVTGTFNSPAITF